MKCTYVPPDGEAASTVAYGRKWRANVPVDLPDDAAIPCMESVRTTNPDGTVILTTVTRLIPIIELMRGNSSFQVGDEPTQQVERRLAPDDVETAPDYRRYALQWFAEETSVKGFQERWEDEEGMRERAGVTDDDINYLKTFMGPRLHELQTAARDDRMQARMTR